jgi:hypothetical protein
VPAEPIWLHPEAIREAHAAREWYTAWSDEVADAFMAEMDSAVPPAALSLLCRFP